MDPTEFSSLFVLCNPTDPNTDIVFVHDLGGDREKSWTHSNKTFWPKDLLPQDCPTARILSFGYKPLLEDFYPSFGSKQVQVGPTIDDHSNALLQDLTGFRTETNTQARPVIFVAHGLGGLVCANALSKQHGTNNTYKHIVDKTLGLLFLGTPFEKSKANYAEIFRLYRLSSALTNNEILKDLEERSEKLVSINEAFLKFVRHRDRSSTPLEIACVFEEMMTILGGKGVIMVPRESATLPGFDYYSIPANHFEMCKFIGEYDAGYQRISAVLRQWIQAFEATVAAKSDIINTSINYNNVVTGNIYSGHVGSHYYSGGVYSKDK